MAAVATKRRIFTRVLLGEAYTLRGPHFPCR
jgi:hypothetical protein